MHRKLISSGSEFESKFAYSRAVVDQEYVFVSGTTGYDYKDMSISDNVSEQTEQCFININQVLSEAGSSINNIVRLTYIVANRDDFKLVWPVLQKWLANVRPAATMLEARLLNDEIKIEIQATARVTS